MSTLCYLIGCTYAGIEDLQLCEDDYKQLVSRKIRRVEDEFLTGNENEHEFDEFDFHRNSNVTDSSPRIVNNNSIESKYTNNCAQKCFLCCFSYKRPCNRQWENQEQCQNNEKKKKTPSFNFSCTTYAPKVYAAIRESNKILHIDYCKSFHWSDIGNIFYNSLFTQLALDDNESTSKRRASRVSSIIRQMSDYVGDEIQPMASSRKNRSSNASSSKAESQPSKLLGIGRPTENTPFLKLGKNNHSSKSSSYGTSNPKCKNREGKPQNSRLSQMTHLLENFTEGRSGSFFYFTRDNQYIVKTVSDSESKLLDKMLPDYFEHLQKNPRTLLSKLFGYHSVQINLGNSHIHFVVMQNIHTFRKKGNHQEKKIRTEDCMINHNFCPFY
eukprot:Pgem_evm1s9905